LSKECRRGLFPSSSRGPHRPRILAPLLAALLGVALPQLSLAGPLLADAARSGASDRPTEARTLAAWLDANPGAPGSSRVLDAYLDAEQDLGRAIQVTLRFVATCAGAPGAAPRLHRVAQLLSLAGRVEEARGAYLASYRAGGQDRDLLEAVLLSLEMNDGSAASRELAEYQTRGGAEVDRYGAVLSLALGKSAGAGAAQVPSSAADDLTLKSLWIAYVAALASGDAPAISNASAALSSQFGGSPEAVIAAGGSTGRESPIVTAYPSPPLSAPEPADPSAPAAPPVFELPAPEPPSAAPAPAQTTAPAAGSPTPVPSAPDSRLVGVQAGSFRVKENADYLAHDLQSKGFSPSVREQIQDGKSLYRVIVAAGISPADAAALLDRLAQAGFGGLIVSSW